MVTLGIRLRALARLRIGVAVSFVLACLAALSSAYNVSVLPPALRSPGQPAGAHTQILVDDRKVSALNAGFDFTSFNNLHEGAVLAGSIMVQDPARDYIARRAGIPVGAIDFTDPQVPVVPPLPAPQTPLKYSLTVAARPTVPIVDVYAQAPTLAAARQLVDASVAGLSEYLAAPGNFALRVTQLGHGAEVNTVAGGALQGAAEKFLIVFALGCFGTVLVHRTRRAWPVGRRAAELAS